MFSVLKFLQKPVSWLAKFLFNWKFPVHLSPKKIKFKQQGQWEEVHTVFIRNRLKEPLFNIYFFLVPIGMSLSGLKCTPGSGADPTNFFAYNTNVERYTAACFILRKLPPGGSYPLEFTSALPGELGFEVISFSKEPNLELEQPGKRASKITPPAVDEVVMRRLSKKKNLRQKIKNRLLDLKWI